MGEGQVVIIDVSRSYHNINEFKRYNHSFVTYLHANTVKSGKTFLQHAILRRYTLIDIMKEADTSTFQAHSKNAHRLQN